MDINRKILTRATGAIVVIGGIAAGLLLSKMPEKADLSTVYTEAATEAPKETLPTATQAPETEETTEGQEDAASNVPASIETYASGGVSIQYPTVDQMDDASKKDKVNELLKTGALSFIKASDIDKASDTLGIKCKVISVDHRHLAATYTGALFAKRVAHPVNLPYPNIINLLQAQNLGLDDFADAYIMAGHMLSDDVKFSSISSDIEAQVLSYRSFMDLDPLTAVFNNTGFPLSSETQWPESFSYKKQRTTYFSLLAPHVLGDHMLVVFDPITK